MKKNVYVEAFIEAIDTMKKHNINVEQEYKEIINDVIQNGITVISVKNVNVMPKNEENVNPPIIKKTSPPLKPTPTPTKKPTVTSKHSLETTTTMDKIEMTALPTEGLMDIIDEIHSTKKLFDLVNDAEKKFIPSVLHQFRMRGTITAKQKKWIVDIIYRLSRLYSRMFDLTFTDRDLIDALAPRIIDLKKLYPYKLVGMDTDSMLFKYQEDKLKKLMNKNGSIHQ